MRVGMGLYITLSKIMAIFKGLRMDWATHGVGREGILFGSDTGIGIGEVNGLAQKLTKTCVR
tara:strand:- start:206 stop:391 length:186 start_codon:yes stop_codon:yes gene_type:complete